MSKIYTLGGHRLAGEVRLSGSKNATLAILAATLLPARGQSVLHNVPSISDVTTMLEMLRHLGVGIERAGSTVVVDATRLTSHIAPYELIQKMRASFSVLGPLLARCGEAQVALPGGCDIGARPVDYHLKGLERMGAVTRVEHGFVFATAPNGLRGAEIFLDFPSVGATTHLMAAAALADGYTTISNAAEEPDVVSTAAYINGMGGRVRGAGTKEIVIEGVSVMDGGEYVVESDRIEAGTFAVAACITAGDLFLRGAVEEHVHPVMRKLVETGAEVRFHDDGVRVTAAPGRPPRAVNVSASPHPGFPTDMQPPIAALLALADGTSIVTEKVYERRFRYIDELVRMGAHIKMDTNSAVIVGVPRLTGAPVAGSDLRATAALVLAGLTAEGESEIGGVAYLDRGYERFVDKLRGVGADVRRADEASPASGDTGWNPGTVVPAGGNPHDSRRVLE
ncbi:MAG: UDP-N-acetylglucosamine 1-carboxyvinyltransferase [Capsulimonadaceae bacterium]